MARPKEFNSNALFEILEDWNNYLKHENIDLIKQPQSKNKAPQKRGSSLLKRRLIKILEAIKSQKTQLAGVDFASVTGFVRQEKKAPRITLRLSEEENDHMKSLSQGVTVSPQRKR